MALPLLTRACWQGEHAALHRTTLAVVPVALVCSWALYRLLYARRHRTDVAEVGPLLVRLLAPAWRGPDQRAWLCSCAVTGHETSSGQPTALSQGRLRGCCSRAGLEAAGWCLHLIRQPVACAGTLSEVHLVISLRG